MTTLLLAFAVIAPSASDYFPILPGTRMTYEETSVERSITVDEVRKPVEIGGAVAIPVETFRDGKRVSTSYYRVEAETISIIGSDPKDPLPVPIPLFRFRNGEKTQWEFTGAASGGKFAEPLTTKGEAQSKGEKEVFGKVVSVIEVKSLSKIGGGKAKEEIEQVALYGKGIGLISMTSTTKIGRRKAKVEVRLTNFELPKESD